MALMTDEISDLEKQIFTLKEQLTEKRRALPPEPISDYTFGSANGDVRLSELFGDKNDLLLVHNMGKGCPYCTLWADGLNGLVPEITSRTGFALVSPNPTGTATEFAKERGWRFPVVTDSGREFSTAVGFYTPEQGSIPGVSAFHKNEDGTIVRTSYSWFGPGDDFCAVWPLLDLLKGGADGWEPDYRL